MNGRLIRRSIVLAGCAALLCVSASLAAGQSSSSVITGITRIDGYKVGSAYPVAVRAFGLPKSSSQGSTTCSATWRNGVTVTWHRTLPFSKWAKACVRFSVAKVGGQAWSTDKGLRVGATQSQMKKLYPRATHTSSSGYTVWTLAKGSGVSLQAWVKKGSIAFFRLATS